MSFVGRLRKLKLEGVAISADVKPDGSLGKVGGIDLKILAAMPSVHTLIVAENQPIPWFKPDRKLNKNVLEIPEVRSQFRVIRAATLKDAVHLLRIARGRYELPREDLPPRNPMFVGRRQVLDELIPEFMRRRKRGYLVLVAGMGFGKTSFMTELVHRQIDSGNCPVYYFADRENASPESVCQAIYVRLLMKYPDYSESKLVRDTDRLKNLLEFVGRSLKRQAAKEPDPERRKAIKEVLYFDAADQVCLEHQPFLLPNVLQRLPARVLCIMTTRANQSAFDPSFAEKPKEVRIHKLGGGSDAQQQQREDIAEYLKKVDQFKARFPGDPLKLKTLLGQELRRAIAEMGDVPPSFFTVARRIGLLLKAEQGRGQTTQVQNRARALRDIARVRLWQLPPAALIREEAARLERDAGLEGISRTKVWQFMGLLAAASEGLSEEQLTAMNLWDPDTSGRIADLAASFFEPRPVQYDPTEAYRFDHPGYQRYILRTQSKSPRNPPKFGEEGVRHCHARLADGCAAAWRTGPANLYSLAWRLYHLIEAHRLGDIPRVLCEADVVAAVGKALGFGAVHDAVLRALQVSAACEGLSPDWISLMTQFERFLRFRLGRLRGIEEMYGQELYNEFRPREADGFREMVKACRPTSSGAGEPFLVKMSGPPTIGQRGFTHSVTSVAFCPKVDPHLATASGHRVLIWDLTRGELLADAVGHQGDVSGVNFSPDGRVVASGSADGTIRLWHAGSGRELRVLRGHEGGVTSVRFSPDGRVVASGSDDSSVRLWNAQTGRQLCVFRGHESAVMSVSFSPDSLMVASGAFDQTIRVWDVQTGIERRVMRGHFRSVCSVSFSPDGRVVASGSNDHTVRFWDVQSGQEMRVLFGHRWRVNSVSFSPNGRLVASGSDDKSVCLWDALTGQELCVLLGHERPVYSVTFSPDSRIVASGSDDKTVRLWDAQEGWDLRVLGGRRDSVCCVSFSPNGQVVANGSEDKAVRLWDAQCGRELCTFGGHENRVRSVSFSADGQVVASGSFDKTIRLWDVQSGRELSVLRGHENWVTSVRFSPQGHLVASGSSDNSVRLWNAKTGREIRVLGGHESYVSSVTFRPDGRVVASGSFDNTIRLWDTQTGRELRVLCGHKSYVTCVSFSPDGRIVSSGSLDGIVRLWDASSGLPIVTCTGHRDSITNVGFSPNGRWLVSADESTVRLWNANSGKSVAAIPFDVPPLAAVIIGESDPHLLVSLGTPNSTFTYRISERR